MPKKSFFGGKGAGPAVDETAPEASTTADEGAAPAGAGETAPAPETRGVIFKPKRKGNITERATIVVNFKRHSHLCGIRQRVAVDLLPHFEAAGWHYEESE